jgi:hypothetical protein
MALMEFGRSSLANQDGGLAAYAGPSGAPGKRTLIEALPPIPAASAFASAGDAAGAATTGGESGLQDGGFPQAAEDAGAAAEDGPADAARNELQADVLFDPRWASDARFQAAYRAHPRGDGAPERHLDAGRGDHDVQRPR